MEAAILLGDLSGQGTRNPGVARPDGECMAFRQDPLEQAQDNSRTGNGGLRGDASSVKTQSGCRVEQTAREVLALDGGELNNKPRRVVLAAVDACWWMGPNAFEGETTVQPEFIRQ